MDNIAYLLFLDVCRFFSCRNTSSMRYSPVVKRFWRVGYRLFHSKWLRFMGSPKHNTQLLAGESEKGLFHPEDAQINFAIPQKGVTSTASPDQMHPGIIHMLIDRVAEDSTPLKMYKLCFDGKKINSSTSGRHGDIDLWGLEQKPTLNERKAALEYDTDLLTEAKSCIETLLVKRRVNVNDLNEDESVHSVEIIDSKNCRSAEQTSITVKARESK